MASALFLSYRWEAGSAPPRVEELDRELRLRGVPMWRDVRDLGAGGLNEDEAGTAIREDCSGCVLYFTESVLDSWFIKSVEMEAVRHRLDRDPDFFVAAVFDGVGSAEVAALQAEIGFDINSFQGLILDAGADVSGQLRGFSTQLLRRYLTVIETSAIKVRVDTWGDIPWADAAKLQLNWSGVDEGAGPLPADWELLKPAVSDVQSVLGESVGDRVLRPSGNVHLAAAFLLGWGFREPTGWTIEAEHARAQVAIAMADPDQQGWSLALRPNQNDSKSIVVRICASADCTRAVNTHRSGHEPVRAELPVFPPDGVSGRTSLEGIDMNGLAAAIVGSIRTARERHGVTSTELYLACPWTLALTLGWNFASSGPVVVHEATADKSTYHPSPLRLP